METSRSCSWCHNSNEIGAGPAYCWDCGHRADVGRLECDCSICQPPGFFDKAPERPIDLDDLAIRAEARAKLTSDRDARDDLLLLADQLRLHHQVQSVSVGGMLKAISQALSEEGKPLEATPIGGQS